MTEVGKTQEYRVLREKVEILNGDRGDRSKAAMRVGEAKDLREFIAALRKGTADVQRDLSAAVQTMNALSASLTETQEDLATIATGLADAQAALASIGPAIDDITTAVNAAEAAIADLDDSGVILASRVNGIQGAAEDVTIPALASADVASPPTAAEHNLLRADVAAIRAALANLRAAVAT